MEFGVAFAQVACCRRRGRGRSRVILAEPDEHELGVGIYSGERDGTHLCQGLHGVAMDLGDARYRVARGKHAAEAGGHKHVASLYVRIAREIGKCQRGGIARSYGDRS